MTKRAFDKIVEGLTEALAIARNEAEPARLHVPPEIDVRAIRRRLRMTQETFASAFGFTSSQIRQWEQGRHRPIGAMRAYLMVIDEKPDEILAVLQQPHAGAIQAA